MAQIETVGGKKPAPRPKPAVPPRKAAPAKRQAAKPAEPEETLTAEEWEKKLAEEEAEKARREAELAELDKRAKELTAPAEERLTKEEWLARMKEEQKPKAMTREEFLAMRQQPQKPQRQMSSSEARVRAMFSQGADDAFGVTPAPEGSAPAGDVQEVSDTAGLLANLKENPIMAGGVTFIGLVMLFIGLSLRDPIGALTTQGIGFVLFIVGGIYMIGHIKIMLKR